MCGFVGFMGGIAGDDLLSDDAVFQRMSKTILTRDPDGLPQSMKLREGFGK